MQNKYLNLAIRYISDHPEYQQDVEQMKFQFKIIGIPENQIDNTVKEIEKLNNSKNNHKINSLPPFHIWFFSFLYLTAIVTMLYFILFFHSPVRKQISYVIPTPVTQTHPYLPETPAGGIVKKVYANEIPVKMEQVFSYPVKDISLGPSIRPNKEVVGFIPYWDLDTLDKLNLDELTTVNIFGIEPDGQGNIIITDTQGNADGGWTMWNDPRLGPFIDSLKKKQIRTNITIKMFSDSHMESMLTSTDAQKKLISNIMYMVGSKNLDGVNLDFEYVGNVPDNVRNGFTSFVSNLHSELTKEFPSATLSIDTYASSGVSNDLFDLSTLSHVVDSFIIMGYDFHTPYTSSGPVAPLTGEQSIVSYLANYLQKVPAGKIILGVPYYGYDWVTTNPSPNSTTILTYADIMGSNSSNNFQWDSSSQTPWYQYTDGQNMTHKVYFEDVRSLGLKYDLVNQSKLEGIGIWAVGYDGEFKELDQLISQKFGY